MRQMSIRDLRQRWPEAEKALEVEEEILITRDSRPVAKLVRFVPQTVKRPRLDPVAQRKWFKKHFGETVLSDSAEELAVARSDRTLIEK